MRQVKLKREDFDNIYFASDFHRNHKQSFLYEPRGFKTPEEHDRFIDSECAKLTEKDILIFLGDTALNSSYEETKNFVFGIKAKKFWIWGNHYSWDYPIYDVCVEKESTPFPYEAYPLSITHDKGIKDITYGRDPLSNLVFFGQELNLKIGYDSFYCRHMAPFIWDKMKHGVMALCGHSHGNCPQLNPDHLEGKILDVGVDNAIKYNGGAFFTYEEVKEIMSKKIIQHFDHH